MIDYEKFVRMMREINEECGCDTEIAHIEADKLLIEFLDALGYKELIKAYEEIDKWYS